MSHRGEDAFSQETPLTVYFALESFLGLFCEKGTNWGYGGAEMQMYYLARNFAARPHIRVVLLTAFRGYTSIYPNITIKRLKFPYYGGFLEKFGHHFPNWIVSLIRFGLKAFSHERRKKLFSDHEGKGILLMSSLENIDLVQAARRHGIKTIYRISGDALVDGTYSKETLARTIVDQLLDLSDRVVVQSEYQRDVYYQNYGRDSLIIPSGFFWGSQTEQTRISRKQQVLWVGRCVAVKRPWLLLELARRIPEAHFAFVAPAPDEGIYQEMKREASELANVTLIPGVPRDEIQAYYAESSVVVNTSFTEGLPNTLIEACAAQTPYVSLRVDARGVLGEDGIGDCAQNDMASFTKMVQLYLTSEEKRAAIGKKAYDYARETWDIARASECYMQLFATLLQDDVQELEQADGRKKADG